MLKHASNPVLWVIVAGVAIRIAMWAVTPWYLTNDNHFPPVQSLLTEGRLPRPDECWVCYHPPLYYLLSASAYWTTDRVGRAFSVEAQARYDAGRKTIQFLSVIAGALTLVVCARVLTRFDGLSRWQRAIGLVFIAFLPRHVFMSAMATNDALAYLWQSAAILAAIDLYRRGWRLKRALLCGLWIGLTLLTKGYGLFTFGAIGLWIIGCLAVAARRATSGQATARRIAASGAAVFAVAVAVGSYPFLRDYSLYGRWHVDNYELHESKMDMQPPGSLEETHFLTFHFTELLARPWAHLRYVDSFWTVVFAGYWFDVIGNQNTLKLSYDWEYRKQRLRHEIPEGGQALGRAIRNYESKDVPAAFVPLARGSYAVGLLATAWIIFGAFVAVVAARRDAAVTLLLIHFVVCVAIVVAQTIRQPGLTTMKSEFTLGMLTSLAYFAMRTDWAGAGAGPVAMRGVATIMGLWLLAMNVWFVALEHKAVNRATFLTPFRVPESLVDGPGEGSPGCGCENQLVFAAK